MYIFILPAKAEYYMEYGTGSSRTLVTCCGAHITFRVCQTCLLKEAPRVLTYFWGEYENAKHCVLWPLPYPMTRITRTIITQTMIPAKKRRRTMKSRLVSIAITNPLERVDDERREGKDSQRVRSESSSCFIARKLDSSDKRHCRKEIAAEWLTGGSSTRTVCNPQRFSWRPDELL